jgi:predicted Fe-S protein YdhL (DUF1289 family)
LNEDKQTCVGCGRSWIEIRDWIDYTDKQRDEIIYKLKDHKFIDVKNS